MKRERIIIAVLAAWAFGATWGCRSYHHDLGVAMRDLSKVSRMVGEGRACLDSQRH
jgi:hypothetical protein